MATSSPAPSSHGGDAMETAVPTLKVMRLQSPDLSQPTAGSLEAKCLLSTALALPDSFGVIHVGETFTAYLGALNVSQTLSVRRLTVTAQLQTPSQRLPLASALDAGNTAGGVDLSPGQVVDAIVSRALEEAGPHILRVEVGYAMGDGTPKTLRKFYRFSVANTLHISQLTVRGGDASCFISLIVENVSTHGMTIASIEFNAAEGLEATRIAAPASHEKRSAVELFDSCGRLEPNESTRYLFLIKAVSETAKSRGVACGDELGCAVFTWRKSMGEAGRIASFTVYCPEQEGLMKDGDDPDQVLMGAPGSRFVVQGSGLSVDVAASAVSRATNRKGSTRERALELLPVTVEPIDAPTRLELAKPTQVQFLVVNHSGKPMNLQLQMRLSHMSGVAVCGLSFKNLGEIPGSGGSCIVEVRLIALVAGLLRVQGCCMVDLTTAQEIPQPPLFNVFCEGPSDQ